MQRILKMIEEALGADGVICALFDGADPIDREFGSVRRDYRLRNPGAPRDPNDRPASGAFRLSELPAPPA